MPVAGHGPNERSLDPGSRLILGELRDLRLEVRADRQRADGERRKSDEDLRKSDEERRNLPPRGKGHPRQQDEGGASPRR